MNVIRLVFTLIVSAAAIPAVMAHPLPSFQFDRVGVVRISNRQIEIDYSLDVSLFAMVIDAKNLFTPEEEQRIGGRQKEFAKAYGEKKAPLIADAIRASYGDRDLSFESKFASVTFEETHARFRFVFTAMRNGNDKPFPFRFEDQSFEDKPGTIDWSFADKSGLRDVKEPVDLRGKSPLDMTTGDAVRRRMLTATVDSSVQTQLPTVQEPTAVVLPDEDRGLFQSLSDRGLVAFFDSNAGIVTLLFAAAVFGMAHAVTPGHGKTLVAAYLVGEKGTMGHAIVLGLTTTLAHTGSVIAVAVVLWYSYRDGVPESARAWLQLIGGLLILFVGLWLLLQRLRGRADHLHLSTGKSDGKKPFGWMRVILLGLAGGMIPCWDAVLLLIVAISAGRLGFALPLLVSFSVGLSAVLIALGIGVVLATRAGGRSFGDSRWFKLLPSLSAAFLVVVGVWFVREAFHMFEEAERVQPVAAKG